MGISAWASEERCKAAHVLGVRFQIMPGVTWRTWARGGVVAGVEGWFTFPHRVCCRRRQIWRRRSHGAGAVEPFQQGHMGRSTLAAPMLRERGARPTIERSLAFA